MGAVSQYSHLPTAWPCPWNTQRKAYRNSSMRKSYSNSLLRLPHVIAHSCKTSFAVCDNEKRSLRLQGIPFPSAAHKSRAVLRTGKAPSTVSGNLKSSWWGRRWIFSLSLEKKGRFLIFLVFLSEINVWK